MTWSKTSGSETPKSKTKKSKGETSGPQCQRAKRPKCQGAKRPDPKCQGAKRPGQNVRRRNVLVQNVCPKSPGAKILPEPTLHDCETSSMIVTFPEASL